MDTMSVLSICFYVVFLFFFYVVFLCAVTAQSGFRSSLGGIALNVGIDSVGGDVLRVFLYHLVIVSCFVY